MATVGVKGLNTDVIQKLRISADNSLHHGKDKIYGHGYY